MRRVLPLVILSLIVSSNSAGAQQRDTARTHSDSTTLIILGVDHSAQLGARHYHAGFFRAFFDRVHPKAICVERSPDEFARGDFYEFTYEVQYIAVPYARAHGIEICPIDWLPGRDDERLAFGRLEVVDPPIIRPDNGFQGFLTLDSASLRRTLYFADSEPTRAEARAFFDGPRGVGRRDFPRRLDLYRTYLQAMRILAMVNAHRGDTVLVVIGSTHKDDIEQLLRDTPDLRIVQPSHFPPTSNVNADAALSSTDLAAILSFNLLGVQSVSGHVDTAWVRTVLDRYATMTSRPSERLELQLLQTRFAVLHENLAARDAAARFEQIAHAANATDAFTFRAAVDTRRLDTYFDPFGNMGLQARAWVEAAREWRRAGVSDRVKEIHDRLRNPTDWSSVKLAEFDVYWARYIMGDR